MKEANLDVVIWSVVLFAATAGTHSATVGIEVPPESGSEFDADLVDPVPATAGMGTGLNYSTGFEPEEGFVPGYIGGGTQPAGCGGVAFPCWGTLEGIGRSLIEGHIDTTNPFAGAQHLRIARDPAAFIRGELENAVDARYPQTIDLEQQPISPTTITMRFAIDNEFGQNFRIQPQSVSQGLPITSIIFSYLGGIYVMASCDDLPGGYLGSFDAEYYHELQIAIDPCSDTIRYTISYPPFAPDRMLTTCVPPASSVEQLLIFGNNYPGSSMDIDDLTIESGEPCLVYGACCDTNGIDFGCVDSTLESECAGPDKIWTANTLCADLWCFCIPSCTNRECGSTGCVGTCGSCDDGNLCNGTEPCVDGQCTPGSPPQCDDSLFCNGLETCSPAAGCVPGNPPCAYYETCDEDTDACVPDAIPTVSQWGLVVLTIVLLVAAKVQFGRRKPT